MDGMRRTTGNPDLDARIVAKVEEDYKWVQEEIRRRFPSENPYLLDLVNVVATAFIHDLRTKIQPMSSKTQTILMTRIALELTKVAEECNEFKEEYVHVRTQAQRDN
jgi:hypothetical protein